MNTNLKKLQDSCYTRVAHNLVRLDKDKFYDLIITTCADIASKAESYKASDLILKHFGLKDELQPLE
jgi:hypothetical protein